MHSGIAVALAWPETKCKKPGAWYDNLMEKIGVSKDHYYKVGHAAIILIETKTGNCHYFDFGRYHAPYGHGRVRDVITDHELIIKTKANINNNTIENYNELVTEVHANTSCHGTGYISAAYTSVSFEKAYKSAKELQSKGSIAYGPFVLWGTNCSRFVRTVILAGKPQLMFRLKLMFPLTITPTPKSNIVGLNRFKNSDALTYV